MFVIRMIEMQEYTILEVKFRIPKKKANKKDFKNQESIPFAYKLLEWSFYWTVVTSSTLPVALLFIL